MPGTINKPRPEEILSWNDVERLIDELLPQLQGHFDALLMVTRGGIVPGGIVAEALDIRYVMTAAVHFVSSVEKRLTWPTFLQFPVDALLRDRRVLIMDDIWSNGRTIMTVSGRVRSAGGRPEMAVLHYKPAESLFPEDRPDYFAAVTDRWIVYPWEMRSRGQFMRRIKPVTP